MLCPKFKLEISLKRLIKSSGTTVILTTHDMQDIEALTDRIILIGKGQKLFDGKLSDIKKKYKITDGSNTDEIIANMYKKMRLVA